MEFKKDSLKGEFNTRPQRLQKIANHFWLISETAFEIVPVVTRVLEKIKGSSGVHEAGRAIDFRGNGLYTDRQAELLCELINEIYPRDDGFKVMIYHSFKRGPKHFHMQIPSKWA